MKAHEHQRPQTCCCYQLALEPSERCPVHGCGEWPPRCEECGQYMPWPGETNDAQTSILAEATLHAG